MNKGVYPWILILLLTSVLVSCGRSGKKSGALPPVKIEIPSELAGQPEVVSFIRESEVIINQFTVTVEDLVEKLKPYADQDFESLGLATRMRLMAIVGQAAMSFAEFSVKQAEIMEQGRFFEEQMDENHAQAIGLVLEAFAERLDLLEEKYQEIDKD